MTCTLYQLSCLSSLLSFRNFCIPTFNKIFFLDDIFAAADTERTREA